MLAVQGPGCKDRMWLTMEVTVAGLQPLRYSFFWGLEPDGRRDGVGPTQRLMCVLVVDLS